MTPLCHILPSILLVAHHIPTIQLPAGIVTSLIAPHSTHEHHAPAPPLPKLDKQKGCFSVRAINSLVDHGAGIVTQYVVGPGVETCVDDNTRHIGVNQVWGGNLLSSDADVFACVNKHNDVFAGSGDPKCTEDIVYYPYTPSKKTTGSSKKKITLECRAPETGAPPGVTHEWCHQRLQGLDKFDYCPSPCVYRLQVE